MFAAVFMFFCFRKCFVAEIGHRHQFGDLYAGKVLKHAVRTLLLRDPLQAEQPAGSK